MKRILIVIATLSIFSFGLLSVRAVASKPPAPPGKDPCSHGNTGKPCRPDPQPDRGKDCEHHGKEGGVNEDHCKGETTPPTTTTTTNTTPSPCIPRNPDGSPGGKDGKPGNDDCAADAPLPPLVIGVPPGTTPMTPTTPEPAPTTTPEPPVTTTVSENPPNITAPPTKPRPVKPQGVPKKAPPVCVPGEIETQVCGVQGSG